MISSLVIVFRETLEAALIVSIVLAASRGIRGRALWVTGGVAAGLVGAGVLALGAGAVSELMYGTMSDLFNASILLVAALMLAWHQIWMGVHGQELAGESKAVSAQVKTGARPLSALAIVTAIAVLREGSETVLFLYGIAAEGAANRLSLLAGGAMGLILAAALGWVIYMGLLRVPLKHIFKVTGIILILLAAGLAAQAAAYLVQYGLLPPLGYDIWNTSSILPQQHPLGLLLHVLIGYTARPEGMQILFYAATVAVILIASSAVQRQHRAKMARAA